MRIAIIHDWLLGMRGGERCLDVLCKMYPDADLYTAFYNPNKISLSINHHKVFVSCFNMLPFVRLYYRYLLPFYPLIALDLECKLNKEHKKKPYDLVLSVSHCLAKNVEVPKGLNHLCYCLTPIRYVWDQYEAYFGKSRLKFLIGFIAHFIRKWDVKGASRVDYYIAISNFVRDRIKRLYSKDAEVIYPPVESCWIKPKDEGDLGSGFVCVCALVPYKNVDLVVRAFNELGYSLTIVGQGPEEKRLKALANDNIKFYDFLSENELSNLYRSAKAMIFAAEEDFGMTPVEMQAAGRPVICLRRGGAIETVSEEKGRETGVFFSDLSVEALKKAVRQFLENESNFKPECCLIQAAKFSKERFIDNFKAACSLIMS